MKVAGLDLSLTATGIVTHTGPHTVAVKLPAHATEKQRVERLEKVLHEVGVRCIEDRPDLVLIEGPSFNAKFSHAHSLGELAGVVKLVLFQVGIPFVSVPPAVLKKFATGNGAAPKDAVLIAAVKYAASAYPQWEIANNNEADALWLYSMGVCHLEGPVASLSKVRQASLEKVEWPKVREVAASG